MASEYVTLEHLLYAMLDDPKFSNILKGYGTELEDIKNHPKTYPDNKLEGIKMTHPSLNKKLLVLKECWTEHLPKYISGRSNIDLTDVFLSLLSESKVGHTII